VSSVHGRRRLRSANHGELDFPRINMATEHVWAVSQNALYKYIRQIRLSLDVRYSMDIRKYLKQLPRQTAADPNVFILKGDLRH